MPLSQEAALQLKEAILKLKAISSFRTKDITKNQLMENCLVSIQTLIEEECGLYVEIIKKEFALLTDAGSHREQRARLDPSLKTLMQRYTREIEMCDRDQIPDYIYYKVSVRLGMEQSDISAVYKSYITDSNSPLNPKMRHEIPGAGIKTSLALRFALGPACQRVKQLQQARQQDLKDGAHDSQTNVHEVQAASLIRLTDHADLLAILAAYKITRTRNPDQYYHGFFSKLFGGYSKQQKINAVTALEKAINGEGHLTELDFKILRQGSLGRRIAQWEKFNAGGLDRLPTIDQFARTPSVPHSAP